MSKRVLVAATALGLFSVGLAACSTSGTGTGTESGATSEAPDGPITLEYWGWGTPQPHLVEAWNASHPDIQIKHTDAGGGTDSSAKLVTATRAGEAPDVAVVEFNTLPAMIVADVATDITPYVEDARASFTDSVWGLTTFNDAIYGVPQDVGPQAVVYNTAKLEELGIAVPQTWDEFATAAQAVRDADSESYLATLAPGEFGFFAGMAQQAGAEWWKVDGESWTVGIDSEASLAVADYWQDLVDRDLVSVEPLLTPEWNNRLNQGKILSWPSALWAPGVIYGVAPEMAGDWSLAAFPQWEAGNAAVAYQGGSAVVVTTSSDYPEQAAEFAAWINSSPEAAAIQLEQGQYPASIAGQELATESEPPLLMPQQTDFWSLAAEIASDTIPEISWGPNVNVASSAFQDAMSKAAENGTPFRDAFIETQQVVVDDMVKTGFTVTE